MNNSFEAKQRKNSKSDIFDEVNIIIFFKEWKVCKDKEIWIMDW